MSYRGEDLDLRTPQNLSASEIGSANTRVGPIWVDDTVLACTNHAFDAALAHRAGEVRLEHLLNALTRIEGAAEALEARGVRVAALRRESATIIASEIPVGLPNGKGTPRRSDELAEVLRLAAANAARRNAPASIEDLLFVLFDQRNDLPGLSLLSRHTVRTIREVPEPVAPLPRYLAETRYVTADRGRSAQDARFAAEPARSYRVDLTGTPTDSIQNSRLDALEQMVRALSNDISSERQIVSGLLKDLSKETQAQRSDQGRLQTTLADRLSTLEQAVTQVRGPNSEGLNEQLVGLESTLEQKLESISRSWSTLADRLHALETAVRDRPLSGSAPADLMDRLRAVVDLKPIANRLDIIEEAVLSGGGKDDGDGARRLEERFKSLETEVSRALSANAGGVNHLQSLLGNFERQRGEMISSLMQPVVERVSSVVASAQTQQAAATETLGKVIERLDGVERALAAEIETAATKHQAYTRDLSEVHEALMKLNQNQHTLAGSIDQWRADAAGDLSVISNRLTNLDRDNERPIETLNALSVHMDNMNKMMIERYHRRNRFWYWLFGTDDWIGASWPSQAVALEAERQKFKAPKPADA